MRLSIARAQAGDGRGSINSMESWEESRPGFFGVALRRMALPLSVILVLGAIGILFSPAKVGADTVLAPTQVFASVGNSTVNVYSPNTARLPRPSSSRSTTGPRFLRRLRSIPATRAPPMTPPAARCGPASPASSASPAGTDNFYVTDDYSGQISEYNTSGALVGVFASGLQNPISMVFDNSGNIYVGQQTTPYIAEYASSGQAQTPIGPAPRGRRRRLDRPGGRRVHLLLHDRGHRHLRYNKCANDTKGQQSTSPRSPSTGPTPSS